MPQAYVKKVAKEKDQKTEKAEKNFKKAEKLADKYPAKDKYAVATKIFKNEEHIKGKKK